MLAVVDTGPLYAAADLDDAHHAECIEALGAPGLELVIPALVVAETTYLIGTRLGPEAEARFLRAMGDLEIEAPLPDEWDRIAELVDRYRDFPLGGTDASIVALAERLRTRTVITLDRRHFGAVKPRHCRTLQLMP